MLRRATRGGVFAGAGFPVLGRLVVRHPLWIIASWIVLAAVLFLTIPTLTDVAERNPPGLLPDKSSVLIASREMSEAFNEGGSGGAKNSGGSGNVAVIVLTNERGLTPADEATYRNLVEKLRADSKNVLSMQDFVTIPELRQVMTSKNNQAWQLPINMRGTMGTGEGQKAYKAVVKIVKAATANTSLTANVIGPASTVDDLTKVGVRDQRVMEIATVGIVLAILILVYRNLVAMIMPILMIGIALVVAQQIVAGLGDAGLLGLGPQTLMFMTAVIMGAGVDYAVFLFSRYHECVRSGMSSDDALRASLSSIGKVIAGSAGTTALAFFGLSFTTLGVFSTVGAALSITVAVAFLASITLLPAMIVLVGRRGWVKPRRDLTGRWWRRSAVHIVRKPVLHLACSLLVLIALASAAGFIKYNYDERKNLPADADSNKAYAALDKHFSVSSTVQQFILIQSPQDLHSPSALADMEEMARRVSQLPDISMVRGITRPTGEVLEQAKATHQAGEVGTKLGDASKLIGDNDANLNMLSGGAHKLADTLDQLRNTVLQGMVTLRPLATALAAMQQQYGGTKTLDEIDKTATLVENMRALGQAMGVSTTRITDIYTWAIPMVNALNGNPKCDADPSCVASRADLQRLTAPENAAIVQRIAVLGQALESTEGDQTLDETLRGLSENMQSTTEAARQLGLNDPNSVQRQITSLEQGVNLLADSSRALAVGTQVLVDQTKTMGAGLDQASAFLQAMKRDAANPTAAGFYIPPQILTQPEFKKAAAVFISPDGHTARYLVQTALNPFGVESMDQVKKIIATADSAKVNTTLADAKISMVGFSAVQNDMRNFYNGDIHFIIIFTLVVVLLILIVLLRSLVAPLYLVGTVILSYLSALGIGVVFFQFILGQQISWTVPGMTFLVLVAVGADYNLLLISRIRDEAGRGLRTGVIKTVGATGGVITSAGLIFAASMGGLTVSSIAGVVQIGFVIGVGLLLDTFLVRTITVPAIAVLLRNANWWPSKVPLTFKRLAPRSQPVSEVAPTDVVSADAAAPTLKLARFGSRVVRVTKASSRRSNRSPARPVGTSPTYCRR
jgi:putative drug exporter of the RND superfamily